MPSNNNCFPKLLLFAQCKLSCLMLELIYLSRTQQLIYTLVTHFSRYVDDIHDLPAPVESAV